MMKLCALMVKGITKIAYRKFRKGKKFSRKGINSDKKNFRRSEGRGGKSDRVDYTNVKCYNCDTSDSESEENYALMANADKESVESSSEAAETKVPQTTYAFHTDDINECRRYLKTMFVSYRDQTLTCERLTSENLAFKKRNDFLEKELVMFHQTQKDRDDAFYVRDEVLKMNESLKTELEKEREIIRTWTNSGKTTQNLLSSGNWKEGLGYGEDENDKGTEEIKPVDKQKPKLKPVKFVTVKSENEKSEVTKELTSDKLKQEKTAEVNIGLMTKKQLKHKLKDVKNANKGNMKNILVLDSGCSGHMTGNKALLSDFVEKAGPSVSYGDGNIGKTLGYGNINLGNVIIKEVALVSGLKNNLLSISQICDRGYHIDFFEEHCEIKAKQRKSSFKSKSESSILEPYHLLHVDLFGPVNVMSIAKKKTSRWRALLAGEIAGSSMLLTGLETEHTSLEIFILMRAAVLASRYGIKSRRFGNICKPLTWAHGDIVLMCLASSQIFLWHSIYTSKEYRRLYYDYYQIKPSLKKVSIVPSTVNSDSKSDSGNRKNILVLDSGCSGHMTGNKALLSDFVEKAGPSVSYGDGNIGKTLGYGNINLGNVIIKEVALVSGLKNNLLSISQICDRGYHIDFFEEHCEIKAKQRKSSFKSKTESSILEPYHLLHVDLFGPVNVMSIAKKKYTLVIVDEFTRYTWVYFLHTKSETASILIDHVKHLDKMVKDSVKILRSDNGTEFKNLIMEEFYKNRGIKQEFSAPGTPQQNGVV
ncbi:hypothetical protein AgCh_003609 [Apium graveolens]